VLGGGGRRSSLQPPAFIPTLSLSHKFRYENGGNSGTFNITRGNLLNQILIATSTMTTVRIIEAIRLKSVEVWGSPPALGSAPTDIQVEWLGENSPSTVISDTSMGIRPSHVATSPPPSSSNKWWSISGTSEADVLFSITLPAESVIDVNCELRLVEKETPIAGDAAVAATLGQVYGDYLDGIASGKLVPSGFTVLP